MATTTTYERAGIARIDVTMRLDVLAGRFAAACEQMTAAHYRHDGRVPADVDPPPLPDIPALPAAYLVAQTIDGEWDRRFWREDADAKTAVHRNSLPGRLRPAATPGEVVDLLESTDTYVAEIESLAAAYLADVETAVARHTQAAEGHVRKLAVILAEQRRAREAAAAKAAATEADEEAATEAAKAERDEWIAEHGSSRLQRLAAEGIEHGAVYHDERLAAERPGWQWEPPKLVLGEPRNPPEEALNLLDRARASTPDARLSYYRVYRPADEDDDAEMDRADADGDVLVERGYVASAEFLGRGIVTADRLKLELA